MEEIWKDIPGFLDYKISNYGNLLSVARGSKKLLKGSMNNGYVRYEIRRPDGSKARFEAHQLVMLAFVGETPKGKVIIHKDLNRKNNYLENLEFDIHPTQKIFMRVSANRQAVEHSVHPTVLNGSQNWVDGCHCSACQKNNPAFSHSG